jgi:hypothetical protein
LALALAFVALATTFSVTIAGAEPAVLTEAKKLALVADLRHRLLESVEAEKSAVLATTDAESAAFAGESRRAALELNRLRGELRALVVGDGRASEVERLASFDEAWAAVEAIDAELLELAVAGTNLAATRLAGGEGAAALDRAVTGIGDMERASSNPGVLRDLSAAAVSALLVQTVLIRHIPSADEAEMTMLERRIDELVERVDRILADVAAEEAVPPDLSLGAAKEWAEYRRILAEVLRLSRRNTNVLSFDLAVHGKRDAMRRCLDALDGLDRAIESVPEASR